MGPHCGGTHTLALRAPYPTRPQCQRSKRSSASKFFEVHCFSFDASPFDIIRVQWLVVGFRNSYPLLWSDCRMFDGMLVFILDDGLSLFDRVPIVV